MTPTESSTTSDRTRAARVQRFMADFLAIAEPLELWARVRIRGGLRQQIDPEDMVQEICIRAYTNYPRFDPVQGSFRSWVFGIATKVLLQQLRTLRREGGTRRRHVNVARADLPDREVEILLDSVSSITSKVARREAIAAVLEEIEQLERQEYWLLLYRGLERLEFAEIGERLGLHPEAARARWRRLVERLRQRPKLKRFLD